MLLRFLTPVIFAVPLIFGAELSPKAVESTLVVYSSGIGLVHEKRQLSVAKGKQRLVCPGVAKTVQPETVNVKFPEGLDVFSQQYRYDKITVGRILKALIGKKVRYKTGPEDARTLEEGVLLAADPAVVKTNRGIESGIRSGDFVFDALPDTLMMTPALVWKINAAKKAQGEMTLEYLISGIRWKSDYVLNLHGDEADLTGWATVENRSGKRFDAVNLYLLAGEISRPVPLRRFAEVVAAEKSAGSAIRQAHDGYQLYSIPFRVNLADNEKTQVKFVEEPAHPVIRRYDAIMQNPFSVTRERKFPVKQSIELAPFDVPLPGGIVRTFSHIGSTTVLLGESPIENTPKGETVALQIGTHFDLAAKNKLLKSGDGYGFYDATVRYAVANHSYKSVTLRVDVPGIVEDEHARTTVKSAMPYTRPDGSTVRFTVKLRAGESKTWDVAYRMPKE